MPGTWVLFLFTLAGLLLAFGAMALGVLLGRAPLRPGCGTADCEACERPCARAAGREEKT